MEFLQAIAVILSALAAVLAWIARHRWSKEFAKAKDAQIETLKLEIENLRQLAPPKLREYYVMMKDQLEEFNENLQNRLSKAREEVEGKAGELDALRERGNEQTSRLALLEKERDESRARAKELESQAETMKEKTREFLEVMAQSIRHVTGRIRSANGPETENDPNKTETIYD